MQMALLRTLGVAVFPFVLTLQGCGNAGNADDGDGDDEPSTPTPAPQLRTFGIRVLNPHNMPLVLHPDWQSPGRKPPSSISWVEDTPGFPGENSTDGQSVNWVNHTDFFNFSGVGAAHGVMEFHCGNLAHVAIGIDYAYFCQGPSWDRMGSGGVNLRPADCPYRDRRFNVLAIGARLEMDFPHCYDGSEPPLNIDGSDRAGAAQYYHDHGHPNISPEEGDLLQLLYVDNKWATFEIKDYMITHLPSHCNFDHCVDALSGVPDTALPISV